MQGIPTFEIIDVCAHLSAAIFFATLAIDSGLRTLGGELTRSLVSDAPVSSMVPSSTAEDAEEDELMNSIVERFEKGSLALSPNLLGVERIVRNECATASTVSLTCICCQYTKLHKAP